VIEGYTACESRFYNITRFFRRKSAARNPKEPDVITKLDPLAVPAGKRRRTPRARGRHAGNRTWHGCDDNALGCGLSARALVSPYTRPAPFLCDLQSHGGRKRALHAAGGLAQALQCRAPSAGPGNRLKGPRLSSRISCLYFLLKLNDHPALLLKFPGIRRGLVPCDGGSGARPARRSPAVR